MYSKCDWPDYDNIEYLIIDGGSGWDAGDYKNTGVIDYWLRKRHEDLMR
jgi:hypothetical protein